MENYLHLDNSEVIHYLTYGSGRPLILLPSLGLTSKSYEALGQKLSSRYTVYIPDIYKGKSKFPHNTKSLEDYANKLHQFVNALRLIKFYLVGVSASGYLATQYVLKYPEEIIKLCLVSTFLVPLEIDNRKLWLLYSYGKLCFHNLFSVKGIKTNLLWTADGLENLFKHPRQVINEYLLSTLNIVTKPNNLMVPTKLIFASKDEFIPYQLLAKMKEIGNLEIEVVDRYHGWFFHREEELARMIIKFFLV